MKKTALLLSAFTFASAAAFAADPAKPQPVAPAAPAAPSLTGAKPQAPAPAMPKAPVAPVQTVQPAASVKPGQPAAAPVAPPPVAATPAPAPDTTAACKPAPKAKHKKKLKPKVKAAPVEKAHDEEPEQKLTPYEQALKDQAAHQAARQRIQDELRQTAPTSNGCAFLAPAYEHIVPAAGGSVSMPLPGRIDGDIVKVNSTEPWMTVTREGQVLNVTTTENTGEFRTAHITLEVPGLFCDVMVNQIHPKQYRYRH